MTKGQNIIINKNLIILLHKKFVNRTVKKFLLIPTWIWKTIILTKNNSKKNYLLFKEQIKFIIVYAQSISIKKKILITEKINISRYLKIAKLAKQEYDTDIFFTRTIKHSKTHSITSENESIWYYSLRMIKQNFWWRILQFKNFKKNIFNKKCIFKFNNSNNNNKYKRWMNERI